MLHHLASCSLVTVLGLSSLSQAQEFVDSRGSRIGLETTDTRRVFVADLDGNGTLDLARQLGESTSAHSTLLFNQGNAPYRRSYFPNIIEVMDMDLDGDADLVLTSGVAENDGSGGFQQKFGVPQFVQAISDFSRAVHGDLNGDGRQDLIVGGQVFLATGNFTFAAAVTLPNSPSIDRAIPVLVDFDRDGDLDALLGVRGDRMRMYFNDGLGSFTDVSASRLAVGPTDVPALAVADFNGNGFPDVLVHNGNQLLFLQNSAGTLTLSSALLFPQIPSRVLSIAIGDVDGDSDLDVAVGRVSGGGLLLNTNNVFARSPASWSAGAGHIHHVDLVDLDGDGDLDLITGRRSTEFPRAPVTDPGTEDDVIMNDGSGRFDSDRQPSTSPWIEENDSAVVADWNGDGLPDLLTTSDLGTIQFGTGNGDFGAITYLGWAAVLTGALLSADLDGDGDLDGVVIETNQVRILRNPGNGRLTIAATLALGASNSSMGSAIGDFDGNGTLDLVVASVIPGPFPSVELDQFWLGDGSLGFTRATANLRSGARSLAAGDVDRDGDLDLVSSSMVFENQSTGGSLSFLSRSYPTSAGGGDSVQLVDVDADGALDIVASNLCSHATCSGAGHPNAIHWNDGTGNFPVSLRSFFFTTQFTPTSSAAVADFDEDGDLDLYFGNLHRGTQDNIGILMTQDSPRVFRTTRLDVGIEDTLGVFAVDMDQDGDIDIVEINSDRGRARQARLKILLNTRIQLHASVRPRSGSTFDVDAYGIPGGGTLILSGRPTSLPTPLGHLGVDLSFGLIAASFPSGPAQRTARFSVPATPTLIGGQAWLQALGARGAQIRLSNTLMIQILGN